jgi:putative ABC transport system ATP-binding protein
MIEIILETRKLTKKYAIGKRQERILDGISLSIFAGEFVVVSGSSGSGKTTLLSLLSGLDRPSSGRIFMAGQDITEFSEDRLAPIRNGLTGFVFQDFHLVPSLTALENVMFPAELKKDAKAMEKATALLKRVGLWERRQNFPSQLSGGEKQRVAICRAVVNGPRIIFADEPTGNLDSENSHEIISLLTEMHRERETTLVLATHNEEVAAMADRILHLHDGSLVGSLADSPMTGREIA